MIVNDIRVPVRYTEEMLRRAVLKKCGRKNLKIRSIRILRRSIDARKKPQLFYVMKAAVNEPGTTLPSCLYPADPGKRYVVIGAGPAGLFAALTLAEAGAAVTLLERGKPASERKKDVERFFETGVLDPESNIQFGEGGAGTFSDGKLNTLTQDKNGLNARVLQVFYEAGAPEEVLYDARAHIGTDKLPGIVENIRKRIERAGGSVRFGARATDFLIENGRLTGLVVNGSEKLPCDAAVLAIGHSARDTVKRLYDLGIRMEQKAFSVGVRMEHPQTEITLQEYGTLDYEELGAAPYKVTAKTASGRGVYSFCMCPGGQVVNASSEEGHLCINGMSDSARSGRNANAGIVVQVSPEDYPSAHPLAGIEFQRELEKKAYLAAGGRIPVQLYGDYRENRVSEHFGGILPDMKGAHGFANIRDILPETLNEALLEAIPKFGRMIPGFDRPDAVMSAVESRTSSPVRIPRNERLESSLTGLYPCGEGAGYAGGIVSAAMDGIRIAEKILENDAALKAPY